MAANKQHRDYLVYIQKCKALSDFYFKEEDAVRAKYPTSKSLDHPATEELREISRRRNKALKALQREYFYLFEENL